MTAPASTLEQVQTYQNSGLALLQNQNPWIATANKKFQNFDSYIGQLGKTVNFDLPPRFVSQNSLSVTFTGVEQRVQPLTVDQEIAVPYSFSAQDFMFNVDEYMDKFGRSSMNEIGAKIGANVALNAVSNTYRAFNFPNPGDAIAPINSYQQYAQALANFRNYGSTNSKAAAYIDDVSVPAVVGGGLNQFATDRNNDIANSWMLGDFSNCSFMSTNLLPIHTAGTVGNDGETLTVDAIDPTGTILTLSGATPSIATILTNDILSLKTAGAFAGTNPNLLKFLTFTGHEPSAQDVQVRVVADAIADGAGIITVTVFPALIADLTNVNASVNSTVVAAEAAAAPTHRAGLICAGDPLYLAMPSLPDQSPFATANMSDPDSGASIRYTYGAKFGENEMGFINDAIWGSTLVGENSMRVIYPL
jgi:hypothetical protein